jgi:pyruvate/2-oxoglutarate dehydrogenase complex dihydrolipoamide dehydrogenase (E3) component
MTNPTPHEIDDAFNRAWLSQVRPDPWTPPTPRGRYNLVVVGGGTAGLVAAAGAAGLGAKVALVERDRLGGDCLNTGCVPSKVLLAEARRSTALPKEQRFVEVMRTIRQRRAEISHHDSAERFQQLGVDVFLGAGRFTSATTISVGESTLRFKNACIATGARARLPELAGIEGVEVLTNESIFSLQDLPASLCILGGGPIGCEMAEAFSELGTEVTLLERGERILGRDDPEAATLVQAALVQRGVKVVTHAKVQRLESLETQNGVTYTSQGRSICLEVDQVLASTGRQPNVEGLGLESLGIDYDARTGIQVNDRLQTNLKHIFAAGDVCTSKKFTHHADFMARLVLKNALFLGRSRVSRLVVPWCTYTSPELAHVGITAEEVRSRGSDVVTLTVPFAEVDRAVLEGDDGGFVRVHLKKRSGRILGATVVGPHAGDLISELTVAIQHGIEIQQLGNTMHPYPTRADAIRKLGDAYNRTRLTPFIQRLFGTWLRFRR